MNRAFTLIELLITISIISIVAGIVFVALNPAKMMNEARASRVANDLVSIGKAIDLYAVDNQGYKPTILSSSSVMLGTSVTGCDVDCSIDGTTVKLPSTCVDLTTTLAKYLGSIPVNPNSGTVQKTFYAVRLDGNHTRVYDCSVSDITTQSRSCTPNCAGKECGSDGCGGLCGSSVVTCSNSFDTCSVSGIKSCQGTTYGTCNATDPRLINCSGKQCGDNGCGGVCGTCVVPATCDAGYQCSAAIQYATPATSPYSISDVATVGTVAWTNLNDAQTNNAMYATANGGTPSSTIASSPSATGSIYNYWTNPSNAYADDTVYTTYNYTAGAGGMYIKLSSNAGSTWGAIDYSNGYVQFNYDGTRSTVSTNSSFLSNRTWVPGDFTNANFKLAIDGSGGSGGFQDYYNFNIPTIPSNATITGVKVSATGYRTAGSPNTQYMDRIFVAVYYTTPASPSTSHYLKATGVGLSIPTGATINGIKAEVENKETVASLVVDNSVKIIKGGVISGTDKALGTYWPTTEAYATYGGATDLWGTTWTAADINASNFGLAIRATLGSGAVAQIDYIRMTVYYTGAPDCVGNNRLCGSDGYGGSCGTCATNYYCNSLFQCVYNRYAP